MLKAATAMPWRSRMGAAMQYRPAVPSSSSTAKPCWRMVASSCLSFAGSVMVFGVKRGSLRASRRVTVAGGWKARRALPRPVE